MNIDFKHIQSAHCENGVTTNLLRFHGYDFITEPLAFGLGSGLFYIHIPFITISNGPGISFRTMPGAIFKRTCKSLGIPVEHKKFSDPTKAKLYLDNQLEIGNPVGCQVGVFNLTYFPVEYRFHFNAHNLIVYGKEGNHYSISDPVMETVTSLTEEELQRVRFAKGAFAPKGHIYYPINIPEPNIELLRKGIVKGIKRNTRDMLHVPGGIAGVKGIKFTANQIRKWPSKLGDRRAALFMGQIIRMQEEIGTGGGGFRFIYAAFLEQAAQHLQMDRLLQSSDDFTRAGDLWRTAAVEMAGIYKTRLAGQEAYNRIADMLVEISETEKMAFTKLSKIKF